MTHNFFWAAAASLVAAGFWVASLGVAQNSSASAPGDSGEVLYAKNCAVCHGAGARGGDRAPGLANSRGLRSQSEDQIAAVIRTGIPGRMPPFELPDSELKTLAAWVRSLNVSAFDAKPDGDPSAGEQFFFGTGQCASCHMVAGRGKANGPDLSDTGRSLTLGELQHALDDPAGAAKIRSSSACPPWAWCPQNKWALVNVHLRNGSTLRGFARNQGKHDLQLQTLDGRLHLLEEREYDQVSREETSLMPPLKATAEERRDLIAYLSRLGGAAGGPLTSEPDPISADAIQQVLNPKPGEWPTYNGILSGNRHSGLEQINVQNATRLQLQWSYSLPSSELQTTPVVSDGVMYVSAPDQVCALDSRAGREIWCYTRPSDTASPSGAQGVGAAGGSPNRGLALLGDRVFLTTSDAHLVCLNGLTGGVMWDVNMPDSPGRYSGRVAPLVVGDIVVAGHEGGDGPLRGFLAAYKATTGQLVWRFWTIPRPGEPASETWRGKALETGGGATWLTGSYDSETGSLYWAIGNPFPPTDGSEREGDNLYTDSVVALDAKSGKLRWHYQFTPHDLHDWDAQEPLVLVNTRFNGRDRKLLIQANRNGFFYVLDRTNGELLLAKPFVKRLTWASGVGPGGRPQLLEGNTPTSEGVRTCPAVRGATNWYSSAFNPATRLFYVMTVEDCNIYKQTGRGIYTPFQDPANPPEKYLRAIDIETGKIVWEIPQVGAPEANYSGVLSTAGGLVFYGETGGGFAAVAAKTGRTLWHFEAGQAWKASPMTYMTSGKQYVAIASGNQILSFALPER